jgi:hypothetical protein
VKLGARLNVGLTLSGPWHTVEWFTERAKGCTANADQSPHMHTHATVILWVEPVVRIPVLCKRDSEREVRALLLVPAVGCACEVASTTL